MNRDLEQIAKDLSTITTRPFEVRIWGESLAIATATQKEFIPYSVLLSPCHFDGKKLTSVPLSLEDLSFTAQHAALALRHCMYSNTELSKVFQSVGDIYYGNLITKAQHDAEGGLIPEKAIGLVGMPENKITWEQCRDIANVATRIRYDPQAHPKPKVDYSWWDTPFTDEEINKLPELYEVWATARSKLDYSKFYRS